MGAAAALRRLICAAWLWVPWIWALVSGVMSWPRSLKDTPENKGREKKNPKWDDFDTEYDSTWEGEGDTGDSQEAPLRWSYRVYRNTRAAEDLQRFRHMLKEVEEHEIVSVQECHENENQDSQVVEYPITARPKKHQKLPNLMFYQNKMPSRPDGVYIDEFHKEWLGQYDRLEYVHSYIQWLFPIQEKGLNYDSYILTPEEIKLFRKNEETKGKLLKSYKLMLDFYGIELTDDKTGEVQRAAEYRERFDNLNRNTHNNLRITRILKCLGILGFEHFQAPLVQFFLHETLVKGELPRVKYSVLDYFMFSVLDKTERKKLIRFAFQNFEPKDEFVWCPRRIQRKFLMESKPQTTENSNSNNPEAGSDAETDNKEASGCATSESPVQHDPSREEDGEKMDGINENRNDGKQTDPSQPQLDMKNTIEGSATSEDPVQDGQSDGKVGEGDKDKSPSEMDTQPSFTGSKNEKQSDSSQVLAGPPADQSDKVNTSNEELAEQPQPHCERQQNGGEEAKVKELQDNSNPTQDERLEPCPNEDPSKPPVNQKSGQAEEHGCLNRTAEAMES